MSEGPVSTWLERYRTAGVNYVLLDAARDPAVRTFILEHAPDALSLYAGFDDDLVDVAPYLVALTESRLESLLPLAIGNAWGVLLESSADIHDLRQHFRRFLFVRLENGEEVYFRFYDPRVLPLFLESCDAGQRKEFFGPVVQFAMEDEESVELLLLRGETGHYDRADDRSSSSDQ